MEDILITILFFLFSVLLTVLIMYFMADGGWLEMNKIFPASKPYGKKVFSTLSKCKVRTKKRKGTYYYFIVFKFYKNGIMLKNIFFFLFHKNVFIPFEKINEIKDNDERATKFSGLNYCLIADKIFIYITDDTRKNIIKKINTKECAE